MWNPSSFVDVDELCFVSNSVLSYVDHRHSVVESQWAHWFVRMSKIWLLVCIFWIILQRAPLSMGHWVHGTDCVMRRKAFPLSFAWNQRDSCLSLIWTDLTCPLPEPTKQERKKGVTIRLPARALLSSASGWGGQSAPCGVDPFCSAFDLQGRPSSQQHLVWTFPPRRQRHFFQRFD